MLRCHWALLCALILLRHVPTRTRDKFYKLTYKEVEASISGGGAAAGTCFWMLADDGKEESYCSLIVFSLQPSGGCTDSEGDLRTLLVCSSGYPDWDGFTVYSPAHASTVGVIREHAAALRGHRSSVSVTPSLMESENTSAEDEDEMKNTAKSSWILELLLAGFLFLMPLLLSALCLTIISAALGSANKRRHL